MCSFVRIALATALVATLPGAVSAQAEIGFRGGVNFATLSGDDIDDADSRTTLNVGGFVTLPVSSVFGIQIGAGFTSKGAESTEDGTTVSFNLSYIEIPVLAKISVPSTGNVGLHFLAGPAISFRTSCSFDAEGGGVSLSVDCDDTSIFADGGKIKKTDFGVMVGAGLDFSLAPNTSLLVELMYNLGLSELGDSGVDDNAKNRVFSILAGLSFKLGL